MRLRTVVVLVAVFVLAGCASLTASSGSRASVDWTPQARCERDGGIWHANLGICEVPRP
jgi:outer membrane biogenesis lipoprotein LolB